MKRFLLIFGFLLIFLDFSYADEIQVRLVLRDDKLTGLSYEDMALNEYEKFHVNKEVLLSISKNSDVAKVEIGRTQYGEPKLIVYFNEIGKEKLLNLTQQYSGQQIAMVFNGRILTAPYIKDPINDGIIEIRSSSLATNEVLNLLMKSIGFAPNPEVDTSAVISPLFDGERKERLLDAARNMASLTPRRESDVSEVYKLVNEGVDVNIKDNNGFTPLMMVIGAEDMELTKLLISKGADVNAQDDYGTTALMRLAEGKDDVAFAELLISHGANVDIKDEEGRTALMIAVEKSNYKLAKLFIAQGANITLKDKLGRTLLMYGGNEEFADLLISKGVDINAQDSTGRTALMWAAAGSNDSFVKYLVTKGADLELKDKNGLTALTLAITRDERGVAEYLRSKTHDPE